MVSMETIKEFQAVVKKIYQVELDTAEATQILLDWVGYFDTLAKIDQRNKAQKS